MERTLNFDLILDLSTSSMTFTFMMQTWILFTTHQRMWMNSFKKYYPNPLRHDKVIEQTTVKIPIFDL